MNSLDPWRVMRSSPPSELMVVPAPYFGHPFYSEVPSWITPRDGEQRQLFDGAFIGAEVPAPPARPARRTGLTAEVAPVFAPATGDISARLDLDQQQRLHAAICVDGKCYRTSINLGPVIEVLMAKMAQWHAAQHDGSAPAPHLKVSGDVVIGAVDRTVASAGDALIGALIDQHVSVACAGWLSDIGNAVKSGVTGVASGIGSTLKALKGPIGAAAGIAAATAAMAIPGVGPIVAPIAGKLANDMVQSAAGNKAAQKSVAAASKLAATDPTIAAAFAAAQKAAAQSTAAHHVAVTATKAAAGEPAAQAKIASVVQDAEKGDPAAHATTDLIADAFATELANRAQHSDWGAKLWERATGRGPATVSGWAY